jgi:hypothetical protein
MGPEAERRAAQTRRWAETHDVIGLAIDDVRQQADAFGIVVRVTKAGETSFGLTADRRFNRINVELVDGIVSRVVGLY